ncbi:MAG: preprotein translocase subunit SecG [Candidatus Goldbacteria bacterium]|nr:preprotein translocase subunit SecG [Candidatus Goldiibacteriota bacterium]
MIIYNIVYVIHFIIVVLLIVVVLLQTGKGSEVGFAFGAGAAQTMFGSSGGKTFITRLTIILAVVFMCTSIFLAIFQARFAGSYQGVLTKVKTHEQPVIPKSGEDESNKTIPIDVNKSKEIPVDK